MLRCCSDFRLCTSRRSLSPDGKPRRSRKHTEPVDRSGAGPTATATTSGIQARLRKVNIRTFPRFIASFASASRPRRCAQQGRSAPLQMVFGNTAAIAPGRAEISGSPKRAPNGASVRQGEAPPTDTTPTSSLTQWLRPKAYRQIPYPVPYTSAPAWLRRSRK